MFSTGLNYGTLALLFFSLVLYSCSEKKMDVKPDSYLNEQEQADFLYSISRYHAKLAPKANHKTKFEDRFDKYYRRMSDRHELVAYFPSGKDEFIYFMTYRIAPSIHVKKVACAGRLKYDSNGEIMHYEELFRTWKMLEDELNQKSEMLFEIVLKGKSLEAYLPQNSGKEEFIEFPDLETTYNSEKRRWISSRENPLEELYQLEGSSEIEDGSIE
jgi:hypothetical protein